MKRKKIKYSKEYKEKTLRLCAERGNVSQVARELDLRPSMVYRWQKEQAQYGTRSFPGKGHEKLTAAEAEIKALKK